ncbi:protease II [Bradyrhizobium sp. GM6.1]
MSLLDRGVAFGFVHLRGGGEFGRHWHNAARRNRKRTTYTDLIAAVEALIDGRYASRGGVIIEGASAGGGTVLSTLALRPDLFRGAVAEVPLADILDTELDFSLPYALLETAEYGNPRIESECQYLRSYDPYHNLGTDRPLPPTYVNTAYTTAKYFATSRLATSPNAALLPLTMIPIWFFACERSAGTLVPHTGVV